jgi:hypothetical protein
MLNHNAMRSVLIAISLGTLMAPACSSLVRAAEYSLEYGAEASYENNSNVNLNPDPIEVSGGFIAFPLLLKRRSERTEASFDAKASFYRYDVEEYDSDNQDLQGKLKYQLERGEMDVAAGYLRDSTRDSEFLDTGVVGPAATRRETASAGANISRLFTERKGFVAGMSYRDVSYQADRLQDFDYLSGYGGWLHQWSEVTQLRLQAYGNRFENSGGIVNVSSDGLGVQLGIDTQLSERLTLFLLAGWITVESEYETDFGVALPPPADDESYLVDGRLSYKSERSQWQLRLKSEPTPSGIGVLLNTDRLDLDYRYSLTEKLALALNANVGTQEAQDVRLNQDRDFARGSVRLDYRMTSSWTLSTRYVYSWQDAAFFADTADASAVYLSLRYEPVASVWSR